MEKLSILFVCLGNICRSPAAEAIFIKQIIKQGIADKFIVDSAGTGSWHIGKKADSRMMAAAQNRGIFIKSEARQIKKSDFEKFNYIVTMDNANFNNVLKFKKANSLGDFANIVKIQKFAKIFNESEVPDPYFGGADGFNYVLDILEDSVSEFLKNIK